jgi:adenylosuccinate lyase
MNNSELLAISPVDGRYHKVTKCLAPYFSELGLFRYRIQVEIEYFIHLVNLPLPQLSTFDHGMFKDLRSIYEDFDEAGGVRIKEIEKVTNHDVKAVEYYIKEEFDKLDLSVYKEFIHFGLTSQDINNTATPLLVRDGFESEVLPKLDALIHLLWEISEQWENIPMLARTHGQPASPTRLGKEIRVFHQRLKNQIELLAHVPHSAKFGSASGNFNAHYAAYPEFDWHGFADEFIHGLGLARSFPTTQIEHYDNIAAFCDGLRRINTILLDFARDVWHYISIEYFKQKISKNEVGSSTMPHKVNPIDFENAEGNLGYANASFEFFASKLPVSRLQRDLTDSTVLRNIGVPLAHSYIGYNSLIKGINKLELNKAKLNEDLENNWVIIGEGIQTILRREGYPEPFEAVKTLTRKNEKITRETIAEFIDELDISEAVKEELKALSPDNYLGR